MVATRPSKEIQVPPCQNSPSFYPRPARAAASTTRTIKSPLPLLGGAAVWLHVAERFLNRDDVKQTILVISPDDREYFDFKFAGNAAILGVEVVEGGAERADSVEKAHRAA